MLPEEPEVLTEQQRQLTVKQQVAEDAHRREQLDRGWSREGGVSMPPTAETLSRSRSDSEIARTSAQAGAAQVGIMRPSRRSRSREEVDLPEYTRPLAGMPEITEEEPHDLVAVSVG